MYEHFRVVDATYRCKMEQPLAGVLRDVFTQVASLLEEGMPDMSDPLVAMTGLAPEVEAPSDPKVSRLLPDATDDGELSAEFRRFTDIGLRTVKAKNLALAARSLDEAQVMSHRLPGSESQTIVEIIVDEEGAGAWLTAIADSRIVLAEELGIHSGEDAERFDEWLASSEAENADPVTLQRGLVYEVFADLQAALVRAVSHKLD